jgi:methyl-accepting chemotaxis protein
MKLSFAQKIALPFVFSRVCLCSLQLYDAWQARQEGLQVRKTDLVHVSELALGVVKTFGERAASGQLSVADAQAQALRVLRGLRYGHDGYFAIIDSHARVVMHPIHPEMDRTDASNYRARTASMCSRRRWT